MKGKKGRERGKEKRGEGKGKRGGYIQREKIKRNWNRHRTAKWKQTIRWIMKEKNQRRGEKGRRRGEEGKGK